MNLHTFKLSLIAISALFIFQCAQAQWTVVGAAEFADLSSSFFDLELSPSGELHVAFSDAANGSSPTVMKFDGNNWVLLGSAGFFPDIIANVDLEFDGAGIPYISYTSATMNSQVGYKRFDGNNWVDFGPQNLPTAYGEGVLAVSRSGKIYRSHDGPGYYGSDVPKIHEYNSPNWDSVGSMWNVPTNTDPLLDTDTSGNLIVAYRSGNNLLDAKVATFNGSTWNQIGGPVNASSSWNDFLMKTSMSGKIFLADLDNSVGGKVSVWEYSNNSWQLVGAPGFSPLAGVYKYGPVIGANERPYVGMIVNYAPLVMRYSGVQWENIDSLGLTTLTGLSTNIDMAMAENDTLYLAFHSPNNKLTVLRYVDGLSSVQEQSLEETIAYPNPTNDNLWVNLPKSALGLQNGLWEIFTVDGKSVKTSNFSGTDKIQIDLGQLESGVYFLKLKSKDWSSTKRIVLN